MGREQAPEDRQATEDVLDAMTQYGVEEPRNFVESEDEQRQQGQPRVITAVTMLREDDLDEAQGTQRLKLTEP